jgi:hypothetical protein
MRAATIVAQLSESQVQAAVGEKALAKVAEEIAALEREVADLKASKAELVRAALIECAGGFRFDLQTSIDHLREALVALAAMDRIVAHGDGSFTPNSRIVVEIPAIGGLQAQAVVAPEASIETAMRVWGRFAEILSDNPLASADDEMKFPPVDPHADEGKILYDRLSTTERKAVDKNRAQGVK